MNKNPKVDAFMADLNNPMKEVWEQVRDIVLAVDPKMVEDIKWGAPTFVYKGNLATLNPRAKEFVKLTFHSGALIDDPEGDLVGDAKEARVLRSERSEDLAIKRAGLEEVVKNWIKLKDQ